MPGTDEAYGAEGDHQLPVFPSRGLWVPCTTITRVCYAMYGTEIRHAVVVLRNVGSGTDVGSAGVPPVYPPALCYAMSGTKMGYAGTRRSRTYLRTSTSAQVDLHLCSHTCLLC